MCTITNDFSNVEKKLCQKCVVKIRAECNWSQLLYILLSLKGWVCSCSIYISWTSPGGLVSKAYFLWIYAFRQWYLYHYKFRLGLLSEDMRLKHMQVLFVSLYVGPYSQNVAGRWISDSVNPLSAMVAIWHHTLVSFKVFGTERVHWNLDILDEMDQWEVYCGKECLLIDGCRLNGSFAAHSADIHQSQEQLALRGFKALQMM
jgi:hypothetical protein